MSMMPAARAMVLLAMASVVAACSGSNPSASLPLPPSSLPSTPVAAASVAPARGATWRHTEVEVRGAGFQPGVKVMFGDTFGLGIHILDSGTMQIRTPMNSAGTVDVTVINPGDQRAVLRGGFTFVAEPLPTITAGATTINAGTSISVSWTTGSTGSLDWISLQNVATPGGDGIWWDYTGGAQSGTRTLNAPAQAGQYEFRFLPDDSYVAVARSQTVTVR